MNTKIITLKVEIEIPKNYDINKPELILAEAVDWYNNKVDIISITEL